MHLIMNALEEVTSRAHPNVSEISLLITLVSASAGFEPDEKISTKSRKLSRAYYCAHHSSSDPAVSHDPGSPPARSEEVENTSQLLSAFLPGVIWMENNASAALYPSGHT